MHRCAAGQTRWRVPACRSRSVHACRGRDAASVLDRRSRAAPGLGNASDVRNGRAGAGGDRGAKRSGYGARNQPRAGWHESFSRPRAGAAAAKSSMRSTRSRLRTPALSPPHASRPGASTQTSLVPMRRARFTSWGRAARGTSARSKGCRALCSCCGAALSHSSRKSPASTSSTHVYARARRAVTSAEVGS